MSRWAILVLITLAHALGALAVLSAARTRGRHGHQADRSHPGWPRRRAGAATAGARRRLARGAGGERRNRARLGRRDLARLSLTELDRRNRARRMASAERPASVPA